MEIEELEKQKVKIQVCKTTDESASKVIESLSQDIQRQGQGQQGLLEPLTMKHEDCERLSRLLEADLVKMEKKLRWTIIWWGINYGVWLLVVWGGRLFLIGIGMRMVGFNLMR